MRSFKSSFIIKFSLIFILMLCFAGVEAQKRVVQGVVVNENGEPLAGATITNKDTQENEGATDDDGRYSVQVRPDQVLVFSHVSCYESEINVGTKQILDVTLRIMEHRATEQEIVITDKFVNDVKVEPEVTIVGNTLRVNVLVTIAKNLFESNRRFILQPKTMNMTTKKVTMLSPVVVD